MSWLWIIFTSSILGSLLYWLLKGPKNYLKEVGIPFVDISLLQFLYFFVEAVTKGISIHDVEQKRYIKYGRIYGTSEAKTPVISIADPDILRKILVKDFNFFQSRRTLLTGDPIADNIVSVISGEKWKRIRTIITPAFTTGKIKRMTDIIISSSKALVDNFKEQAGQPIDGKKFLSTFTMDVIASTAFGTKIHSYKDPNNRFIQEANRLFVQNFSWRLTLLFLFPNISKYFTIHLWPERTMNFFKDETIKIIEHRRKTGQTKNDFLQLLMDAENESHKEHDDEMDPENSKEYIDDRNIKELGHDGENSKIFHTTKKYKSLSQNELIAQCIIFFLAGYDTTATTLTCIFYHLAIYPEIQDKLRAEVDNVIQEHDGKLTYDAIQDMKYLDCVISETLRMFPPAVRIERTPEMDYKLEEVDITIKKGTIVSIPIYAIHHDPEFYPEPETFRPERFEPEERKERHPYSYLAFGAGPRNCLGMRFALMEIKICAAYVISQLIIKRCAETTVPLEVTSPLTLLKPKAIFTVEERSDISLVDL